MSLVDQNMVPFQTAYPMIIFIVICVLAGNTCLVGLCGQLLQLRANINTFSRSPYCELPDF